MSLRVIKLPFPATLQDLGRHGWLQYGVPKGGAFDFESLIWANRRLGNPDGAVGLEITLLGGSFESTKSHRFCISGANAEVRLNGDPVVALSFDALPGDLIEIGPAQQGVRSYLCVAGGFNANLILGSASGQKVMAGSMLEVNDVLNLTPQTLSNPRPASSSCIRIIPGPHAIDSDLQVLTNSRYTVSNQSNRTGIVVSKAHRSHPNRIDHRSLHV